jgi:predicted nucleotidyltransferase
MKSVHATFAAALDALVTQIKNDRSILAAILCGSLSHDTVWHKSDIDLVLVTIDDRKTETSDAALYADGVNVHAILLPRTEFRRIVEGSLLYTHDETIADLCDRLHTLGTRDAAVQLLEAAAGALSCIDKAHKWFLTRGDLDYSALWILYAATSLAKLEVIGAGQLVDREVLPQAVTLNPVFFRTIYTNLLNERKTRQAVQSALDAVDRYVDERAPALFAPVIDYLREAGEARSCKDIDAHFTKNFGVGSVTTACEYLADRGLIGKASIPVHLTKKSNVEVQELAFFFMAGPPDAF